MKSVRIRFDQATVAPKRGVFPGPKPKQAMIGGHGVKAFPEHRA